MDTLDAQMQIFATVQHRAGPVIGDLDHVRRWVAADGQCYGDGGYLQFEVCPACPDPDTCRCTDDVMSLYRLTITGADW